MRRFAATAGAVLAALVFPLTAAAQKWTNYAPVAVTIPKGVSDMSLGAFRERLTDPRLCFVKRGKTWLIAGYCGGGD